MRGKADRFTCSDRGPALYLSCSFMLASVSKDLGIESELHVAAERDGQLARPPVLRQPEGAAPGTA